MRTFATIALSLIFLASGGAKLLQLPFEVAAFARWDYPSWFMLAAGTVEVLGGLALWLPRLRVPVAGGLALFMLGAIATHARFQEWPMLVVATTICLGCAWLALRTRRHPRAKASANP
jgi:putative oxidoreductase